MKVRSLAWAIAAAGAFPADAFAGRDGAPTPDGPVIQQDAPPPPPPPPQEPVYVPAAPNTFQPAPYGAPPQGVYAQPQATFTQAPPPDPGPYGYLQDAPRIRLGVDGSAGYYALGGLGGLALGASGRIGVQINNNHAVYAQAVIPIGYYGDLYAGTATSIGIGAALVYEFTLNHWLHFAAGPSVDAVGTSFCGSYSGSASCPSGGSAVFVGADLRVAATIPLRPPAMMLDHRIGLSFILDLHPGVATGSSPDLTGAGQFWAALGLGYEVF